MDVICTFIYLAQPQKASKWQRHATLRELPSFDSGAIVYVQGYIYVCVLHCSCLGIFLHTRRPPAVEGHTRRVLGDTNPAITSAHAALETFLLFSPLCNMYFSDAMEVSGRYLVLLTTPRYCN